MSFLGTVSRKLTDEEIASVGGADTPTCTITQGNTSYTYNDETGELIRVCQTIEPNEEP